MTLEEFADCIDKNLTVTRYANQNKYSCNFDYCEIKEGPVLKSEYGHGTTAQEVLWDYSRKISGCLLVFFATSGNRQEFVAPMLS